MKRAGYGIGDAAEQDKSGKKSNGAEGKCGLSHLLCTLLGCQNLLVLKFDGSGNDITGVVFDLCCRIS